MISDIRMEDEYSFSQEDLEQFRRKGWAPLPGLISRELAGQIMHRLYASDNTVAPTATEKWMTGTDMVKAKPWLLEKYRKAGGQPLRAGDATVHVDLMVHGAGGNTTGRDRAAYTLRYMPTDVIYTGAPHRHFEKFGLTPGDNFADSSMVPHIGGPAARAGT